MKKLFSLFAILLCFNSFAQNNKINLDSLHQIWLDESQPDTIRFKAYHSFIWKGYLFSNPDSAFQLAELQKQLAIEKENKKWEAEALNTQGVSFSLKTQNAEALDYFTQCLAMQKEIGNKRGIVSMLRNIGFLYFRQNKHAKALDYYSQCIAMYKESGNKKGIAQALNDAGLIYKNLGKNDKALDYYIRSLAIQKEIGNKRGIAQSLNNIGIIYKVQGKIVEALDHYTQSIAIAKEIGDKKQISNALNNIGLIYLDQRKHAEALDYFTQSLAIQKEISNKRGKADILNNIGLTYQAQDKHAEALDYHNKSMAIQKEIGNKSGIATSLINMGEINLSQGNYAEALDYCIRGLKLAQEVGVPERIQGAAKVLKEIYKKQNKGMLALEMFELEIQMRDSITSEEVTKQIAQAESRAEFEKELLIKEHAHEKEVNEKKQTRNYALGGGFIALLMAGGTFGRLRYVRKSKAALQVEKDRSENLLLNILPADIAEELKVHGKAEARDFDMVNILFTDFKSFTETSSKLSAQELVYEINTCFEAFDGIMGKYNIEKIKTIGDAYMAAGGLPVPTDDSVKNTVLAALEMQEFIIKRKAEMDAGGKPAFEMRVGVHTGPVVAGIVGVKKFQYDIWGDTVNTASRMESSGEVGKVNISEASYELLKDDPEFTFESRGKIEAKGKGEINMYFVSKT